MNRRKLLTFLASIPFVGVLAKSVSARPVEGLAADFKVTEYTGTNILSEVYAKAGETVTCSKGHSICDFAETVFVGQQQDLPKQLTNWRQLEPTIGQLPLPVCEKCGAKFTLSAGHFHFKDGWR